MSCLVGRLRGTELLVGMLETSPGSGVYAADERLRVEAVDLGSDDMISTAQFSVRLDNEFDTAAARARYQADLRVAVRTREEDASDEETLFEGDIPVQEAHWGGRVGRADESYGFAARHVYERLSGDRRSWIFGRRMRSGEIEDGLAVDPSVWGSRSALVEALPCVFNLDGRPNCSATPLTGLDESGQSRAIYAFTYDGDPNATAWTYLRALRYLVWFYAPREGPVFYGNVFSATEAFVDATNEAGAGWPRRLVEVLAGRCTSLNCEATNLVEALALLSEACGVRVTAETVASGETIRSQFRVWAAGDGARRALHLVRGGRYADGSPRYDASSLSAEDVLAANEVAEAVIRWDYGRIVNAPIVVGDVRAYEMTVPLVPGWLPTADLDDVDEGERAAAKALALTPEQVAALGDAAESDGWYRKYHRDGSEHAAHRFVGRRWVLNEDGRYDGATYNRNAPFDDYQPFDFSTVTDIGITRRGRWSRRARRLSATITETELGARFGVFVEVSYDGGATWFEPVGRVAVDETIAAVVFELANPLSMTPPGVDAAEQNMWYATIDQAFRVRVTAVVESDERLTATGSVLDGDSPTLRVNSRIEYRPWLFGLVGRDGTTNVLADVNAGAEIGRDDSAEIGALARRLALGGQDRDVLASPVIPWLERSLSIGDEIESIRGRGVSFVTRRAGRTMGPVVVGKRYRFGNGRWETGLVLEHGV